MAESGVYHDFTLTKHKKLNLDRRPCVEDETYDFTVCIKEKLSETVGCRLPWDKWSNQDRVACEKDQDFRKIEQIYSSLVDEDVNGIERKTGCRTPCRYKEFRFVGGSPKVAPGSALVAFLAASDKTQIEEEVLLFPFTSLVAEFGGCLGLFLGFSFLTIWQEVRGYFCKQ